MDVYLGNFDHENYLYRNDGDSLFVAVTSGPPVQDNTATLGSTWGDFDNDSDLDLYVVNTNDQSNKYYENDGQGNFTTQFETSIGPPVSGTSNVQSCANADYNNDGYLDIFVANNFCQTCPNALNDLYINNGGDNNFIEITLHGVASNNSAFGSRVKILASINGESVWQLRHLDGNPTGNRSQDDLRLHFGLGDAVSIDSMVIDWAGGSQEILTNVDINQFLDITEEATQIVDPTGLFNDFKEETDPFNFRVYPNPIDTEAIISFEITDGTEILKLSILDAQQKVLSILLEEKIQGEKSIAFSTTSFSSGVYYLILDNGISKVSKKIVILN